MITSIVAGCGPPPADSSAVRFARVWRRQITVGQDSPWPGHEGCANPRSMPKDWWRPARLDSVVNGCRRSR